MKKQFPKFRSAFKKRIKALEENLLQCCDPEVEGYKSFFRKNYYELPKDYVVVKTEREKGDDSGSEKSKSKDKHRSVEKRKNSIDKNKPEEKQNLYGMTLNELQVQNSKEGNKNEHGGEKAPVSTS